MNCFVADPVTFSQLLEDSYLKPEYIYSRLGYDRATWYRRKKKLATLTVEEIHTLADILHLTPAEVLEAILFELKKVAVNQAPPGKDQKDSES